MRGEFRTTFGHGRPRFRHLLFLLALLGGAPAQLAQAQSGPTYVELVLDASGSMFTRLEGGQTRIAAAQAVLTDFIGRLPDDPGLNVGLRLYGARTQAADSGACQDSELVLPLRGLNRASLLSTVTQTRPRGATPIAYSLTQAAADFPTTPGRKLIVLVTDGQESCRGDLRASLDAFKARGIEVDLRIIGIDLDARAQQSFAGVGTFVNTRSAPELAAALGQAVGPVAASAPTKLPVTVTLTSGGAALASGPTVSFTAALGGAGEPLGNAGGVYSAQLLPGAYAATVKTSTDTQTFGGLTVSVGAPNRFTFDVTPVSGVTLTVAPAQPVAGGRVQISFGGAPASGTKNWITVARKTDPDPAYLDYKTVQGASGQLDLSLPDDESEFEARYHLANPDGSTRVIGRSAPFTPRRATVSVTAPNTAAAGGTIQVGWTGPNNAGDYLTVVPKGAAPSVYTNYFYTKDANPGTLTVPTAPGDYEVRYSNDLSNRVLASAPITLSASTYALQGPDTAVAGSVVEVRWTGPGNPRDYVTVVKKDAPVGTYLAYFYTRDGNPGKLRTPLEPGDYELRYSTEATSPNPTLASRPIKLTGANYGLQAPREGQPGASIQIRWTGPNSPGEYVTIVKKGAPVGTYTVYFYTRNGNPGTLKLPAEPGEYELRYSTEAASPNPTLFSVPITVK